MLLESARNPTAEFLGGPVSPSKWGFLQSRVPASTSRPMEVVEGKRSFLNRRSANEPPKFKWGDGGPNNRVLVVIDANKELLNTAMDWALDHVVQHGDALRLLAILQHICNPSKSGFQAGLSRCKDIYIFIEMHTAVSVKRNLRSLCIFNLNFHSVK